MTTYYPEPIDPDPLSSDITPLETIEALVALANLNRERNPFRTWSDSDLTPEDRKYLHKIEE